MLDSSSPNILRIPRRDRGFTLIELVIASLLGAMTIMGAFVILLTFRQQTRIAWAERAMDQYMYTATRYLSERIGSAIDYRDRGVIQNNYAVWDLTHGDLTGRTGVDTVTTISGNRTKGLLIDNAQFDPHFPPPSYPLTPRHRVPMWDRRDSFELLYLGIENPQESAQIEGRSFVEEMQVIVTMSMRYRHRERSSFGFLFGKDYARSRTYQTRVFLRNFSVENPVHKFAESGGSGTRRGNSSTMGWTLASGNSAEEYLDDKWQAHQSHIRPTKIP
jgi:prepilin-type N-terminal cleavage/methylation domain-containing protein